MGKHAPIHILLVLLVLGIFCATPWASETKGTQGSEANAEPESKAKEEAREAEAKVATENSEQMERQAH